MDQSLQQRMWSDKQKIHYSSSEFLCRVWMDTFKVKENIGKEFMVVVENSSTARGYGESEGEVCNFLRGYNAGLAWINLSVQLSIRYRIS